VPLYIIGTDNINDPRIQKLAFGEASGYIRGTLE